MKQSRKVITTGALRFLAFALLLSGSASASSVYPGKIAAALAMPCTPQCTICHKDLNGGFGTLRPKGFGANLFSNYGLAGGVPSTLQPALDGAEADGQDTDGDGTPDITELRAGEDPNDPSPGATLCGSEGPQYGCARVAPDAPIDTTALAASLATLVGLVALRRRR